MDLLTQLRDYGQYHEENRPVDVADILAESALAYMDPSASESMQSSTDSATAGVEADERRGDDLTVDYLRQRPDESEAPLTRKGWSGVVVAVAAMFLVVVGVVVVVDGDAGDVVTDPASTPSVTEPPVSSPDAIVPVVPPSVFDPVSSYRWSLVAPGCCPGGASPDGQMLDVTVGGPGLVAVGRDGSVDDGGDAVVWTSVDGITWSRLAYDEAVFGGGWMESVTVGGPGLVAVGTVGSFAAGFDAAVWTSVDGITWSRVPHDEETFGGPGSVKMSGVTVGGPGLVAIGAAGLPSRFGDGGDPFYGFSAVWTSVDGITWSRVPHDEEIFGRRDEAGMFSVVEGGPGLVAVGFSGANPEGDVVSDAVVWTSVDGLTWSRVPDAEAVFGEAYMSSVTVGGPGLVAVGVARADDSALGDFGDGAVWTSVDGLTWLRVPHDDAVLGGAGPQRMDEVIVGGPGLVAVGKEGHCIEAPGCVSPPGMPNVVWSSVDGISWSRVPHDEAVFGDVYTPSVTVGGPGLVAVGFGGVIVAERVEAPEN